MKRETIRTVHRLKKALHMESVPIPTMADRESEIVMAWAPGQFYTSSSYYTKGELTTEMHKYGGADLAWAREWYGKGESLRHFPRLGVKEFVDSLFDVPLQLSVSYQRYWWGDGNNHRVATTSVSPELASYRELPDEQFGGEMCHVVESGARSERLWISKANGRLRGVATFMHQGYFIPFYKQPIVTEIVGRPIQSMDEYRALHKDGELSGPDKERLIAAWAEYKFDHAIAGRLSEFSDYREISADKWFPFKVRTAGWLHNDNNNQYYTFHNKDLIVKDVFTDRTDLKSYWEPLLPKEGESVQDQRFAAAVDYEYSADRSDEEIQKMVNQQLLVYGRGRMLIDQRKAPIQKLVGKQAFDLPMERWIGERPDLKGKSYLLHCWAAWCGPCKNDVPLLNELAKHRTVIGIHPSGTPMEEIKTSIDESKMEYPTVVAPVGAEDIFGYPIQMFPYVIEVQDGKITGHGSLSELLGSKEPAVAKDRAAQPSVTGEVLAFDKRHSLAVISMGVPESIAQGDKLKVMRDGKLIGEVAIVMVNKNRCVGKLLKSDDSPAELQKGDQVDRQ